MRIIEFIEFLLVLYITLTIAVLMFYPFRNTLMTMLFITSLIAGGAAMFMTSDKNVIYMIVCLVLINIVFFVWGLQNRKFEYKIKPIGSNFESLAELNMMGRTWKEALVSYLKNSGVEDFEVVEVNSDYIKKQFQTGTITTPDEVKGLMDFEVDNLDKANRMFAIKKFHVLIKEFH